ncbi:MAG TPA: Crp/Fnr family transcriptional regulator [Propionibacteriaceae bacterium]|nr:Crp/Fnr family transcriptional regulator [Propionibacteriaceae bacterium]
MTGASPAKPMSGTFLDLLSDLDRSDLLSLGRPRAFRRGASIVVQGDHSDVVLVLMRGLVKVALDTDDGHEIVLSVLRPGDLIGEFEAVDHDGGPRTASNVALEAVDTRVMTGEDFRCYLESHPGAALALLRAIIHRLRNADQRRIDSGSRDTVRRLAHLLAELADEHGRVTSAGIDIDIPLTQQELASLIASSRESIVRSLRSLRSRRLVTTARRRITIRDLAGLRREADGQ